MSEQEKHDQRQQAMRAQLDAVRPSRKGPKALAECLDIQETLGLHYIEAMRVSELVDIGRDLAKQWEPGDDIPF